MAPPVRRLRDRARAAFTLAELVVALGVGGVGLGAFALVVAHEERAHAELARRVRAHAQLREGMTALLADLRAASPGERDIAAGGARDSSIELRATIGAAVVCEVRDRTIVLGLASFVTPSRPGDTAWAYVESENRGVWAALPVADAHPIAEGASPACDHPPTATGLLDGSRDASTAQPRHVLMVAELPSAAVRPGAPLRVTRLVRYSLYRAPDGRWYLGRREWSPARGRFETIQPVSGPYRAYAPPEHGTSGLQLAFFDRQGIEVRPGALETDRIARVAVTFRAPPAVPDGRVIDRRDVVSATIALRDRR